MEIIDYVKTYLALGWSLIPIMPDTKTPAIKWMEFQERRATLDEVTTWLNKGYFLAVVTGKISGIVVVDDDRVKHGQSEWGFVSPLIAKTQSGGKHYYFRYDREIHSHSNTFLHVDLKAWHSYCLLPPFNGREWITPLEINKLLPIPDDVIRLIVSDMEKVSFNFEPLKIADFVNIPEGERTNSLYRLACSIFNQMNKDDGLRILTGVNQTYSPPLDEKEFNYQVSKALQFIKNNPNSKTVTSSEVTPPRFNADRAYANLTDTNKKIGEATGFQQLDRIIGGIRPEFSYLFVAKPKNKKSLFSLNILINQAKRNIPVIFF